MIEPNEPIPEAAKVLEIRIECSLAGKLNLADFQNAVPLVRELAIVNELDGKVDCLELTISSVPAFIKRKVWRIDSVGKDQRYRITDLDVQLDGPLFARLTEAETATVEIILRRRQEDTELARQEVRIELLPRNQWGGLTHLPEMVTAFVQPNEPAVERLLKQAAEILRKNNKNSALDGYKSGAKRAWELASAIWSAIASMGLDYALPPASFEQTGQKVRGAGQITASGLATCLDLVLFFSAAAEQAGLNPLILFTTGHSFTGIWLKPEEFSTIVVDDITALRKRVRLQELVLLETTLVTQRPAPSFSYATQIGAHLISEEKESAFVLAVDVRRARLQRIKPLASSEPVCTTGQLEPTVRLEPEFDEAPDLPEENYVVEVPSADLDPKDRLARWQRKLLDLSLRNNLLNFKGGKKALKLEAPEPGALEDLLSDGQALKLLPMPDLMDGSDPRSQAIYEGREREDVRREHALDALERREVFISLPKEELDSRLIEQFRTARSTLQEGGANTLFLAIGFLAWTREDKAGQRFRAPLVLVPVTLNRKSARSGFTLILHDDEPRFNPTLIEMLRQDYNLNLGVADGELPKDDAGLDITGIWKSVSHAIKDIKGWEIVEDVVLALFSFAKYLMWKDLTERTDQLRENPVVRHLIDTPRESYNSSIAFPNPSRLDREFGPEHTFCPLPADSSQLSAILAAAQGKDFVLIGPPGTGKSQTIANLIAQCLAEDKRVLFVSEKIAALDVVYRRLREVGLGEFCLELHSNKTRKLDVLNQLERAWGAQGDVNPTVWKTEAERLNKLRNQLNIYVERLHLRYSNGLTIYEAIGQIANGDDVPVLGLSWNAANAHDMSAMENLRALVDRLDVNSHAIGQGSLLRHPLAAIAHSDWSPIWQQKLIESAKSVLSATQNLNQTYERFSKFTGLPLVTLTRGSRKALAVLVRTLPMAAGQDWRFVLRTDAPEVIERLKEGCELLTRHSALNSSLSRAWPDDVVSNCHRGLKFLKYRKESFDQLGLPWSQDVIDELRKGLELLEIISQTIGKLSVQYGDQIEQIDVVQLQHDWLKVDKAIWPLSWFGKRKIRKVLDSAVLGNGEPDIEKDIHLLVKISDLRRRVSMLELAKETDRVWAGLKTRMEFAHCAIKFQQALCNVRGGRVWEDADFDPITNGLFGERMARDLDRMRTLRTLDEKILELQNIGAETCGLWNGHATSEECLGAALQFHNMVRNIRDSGPLIGDHDAVSRGDCGPALAADFSNLRQRTDLEHKITDLQGLKESTAGLWCGLGTQTNVIEQALQFKVLIGQAIANLSDNPDTLSCIKDNLIRILGEDNALLNHSGPVVTEGHAFTSALNYFQSLLDQLVMIGGFSEETANDYNELSTIDLAERCRAIILSENRLHAWCAWRKVRDQAKSHELGPLVTGIENEMVKQGSIRRAFETDYCRWWINAVVEEEWVIRTFVSAEHEKRIDDFRALDDKFTALTRGWVRAKLCANLPTQEGISKNSEWGILRHEMKKKKRHLPLRELMTRIPTALTSLTPCMLMSPLSIAQYLAADAKTFDIVVFDEASQIPVWDAIGAIARGKQVVMVGDPKQLPPTNFFNRAESDTDDEDVEGDLESILDECIGANLPTMNITWHYRSRNESLIAFSNHHYYGGSLVTFPSPVTNDEAVSFHYVKGVYEKGGARINKNEAKALVADLVARLKTPGFKASRLTIGVVTFNTEQQSLIEDLLDEERRKNPQIESYFSDSELEPIFVKNLESVQGDERDIMYFSITYGPDLSGTISMNFGPMNREGGERRLNVAITRARHELRVFSSLKAEQMDLTRTQAIGVRDLKYFLEFAERGPRALAEASNGSQGDIESPFEEAVASALSSKGWEIHTQVGVSAFRIDLAVVHPDASGTYLTGIECDGATYHRSATARDRDKLREQVLRGLGWEILRVWSTDWWIDRVGNLDLLHSRLVDLLEASRVERSHIEPQVNGEAMKSGESGEQRGEDPAGLELSGKRPIESVPLFAGQYDQTELKKNSSSIADATKISEKNDELPKYTNARKEASVAKTADFKVDQNVTWTVNGIKKRGKVAATQMWVKENCVSVKIGEQTHVVNADQLKLD